MDTVSRIKKNLDIIDVISGYLSLKKSGKNYKGLCPFHSEDTPSFMVSPDLQIYKCFGCGESGDMFSFVEKVEGIEFVKALEILAEKAGVEVDKSQYDPQYKQKALIYEINMVTARFYHYLLQKHDAGKPGFEYVTKKRKLNKDTIDAFMIGYAPESWDILYRFLSKKGYKGEDLALAGVVVRKKSGEGYIDKFRGRVIFPLIDIDKKIVGFTGRDVIGNDPKYLNTQETPVFNKSGYLFGMDKAKVAIKKLGAIFVEGQMDVVTGYQHGVKNVVASSGTSLTTAQLKIISRYTQDLIFSFDSDEAGMNATSRALDLTKDFNFDIKVIMTPGKYKDLDDMFKDDPEKTKKIIRDPVPIYDFYVANALKKYDPKTAYGKKMVVDYLSQFFFKVKDQVMVNHYVKQLAGKLEISEDILQQTFTTGQSIEPQEKHQQKKDVADKEVRISPEEYLLALLLKLGLDTIGQFLYKLSESDFTLDKSQAVYSNLKTYIDSKPAKFDIKYFIDSVDENLKNSVKELYLLDVGELTTDSPLFEKELNATISRVKKDTIQRELKNITEQIRLAELEGSHEHVEELQKKAKQLAEQRNYYEKS